jgi:hypothetical protein
MDEVRVYSEWVLIGETNDSEGQSCGVLQGGLVLW